MASAFEAITSRQAWYAAAEIEKYSAVQYDADGKYELADGTGVFAGIVQYGAANADEMMTVVKGVFPALGSVDIADGDKVTIDSENAGKFKVAAANDAVYGVALTSATAGDLFTLAIAEVTFTVPNA